MVGIYKRMRSKKFEPKPGVMAINYKTTGSFSNIIKEIKLLLNSKIYTFKQIILKIYNDKQ